MEPEWIESDEIWDSLPGAFDAWLTYGHFPSMRDASITRVEVGYSDRSLRLELLCRDTQRDSDEPTLSTIVLEWIGVVEATIGMEDDSLYDMIFSRDGERLVTKMNQPSSITTIVAATVRVLSVRAVDGPDLESVIRVVVR